MKHLYLLICANDDSITTEIFYSRVRAYRAMLEAYNALKPEPFDPAFEDLSYSGEVDAVLYANGDTVYAWKIVEVSESDMIGGRKLRKLGDVDRVCEYHGLIDSVGSQYKLHCEYDEEEQHLHISSWYDADGVTLTYPEYDSIDPSVKPHNLTKAKLQKIIDDMMIGGENLIIRYE